MPDQQQLVPQGKAAPRPSRRREGDAYYSPSWATDTLLEHAEDLRGQTLLDPCCGDGRMALALSSRFRLVRINDLDASAQARATALLMEQDGGLYQFCDNRDAADDLIYVTSPCWVVTNPPFFAAGDIARAALRHARLGVALLLRSTWLEPCSASPKAPRGERRWLTRLPPTRQIMLGRVSFTGTGTDSAPCSWYIWTRERSGGPWAKGSIVVADQRPGQLGLEVGDGR